VIVFSYRPPMTLIAVGWPMQKAIGFYLFYDVVFGEKLHFKSVLTSHSYCFLFRAGSVGKLNLT